MLNVRQCRERRKSGQAFNPPNNTWRGFRLRLVLVCSIERTLYTYIGPNLDMDEENLSQSKKSENLKNCKIPIYNVLLVILRLKSQVALTTKSSTRECLDVVLVLPL